jgi:predicted membrane protein
MEYRKRRREHKGIFAGLFLLLLGVVLIFQNYYPDFHFGGYIWPGVLIFFGLMLLLRRRRYDWRDEWRHSWHQRRNEWRHGQNCETSSGEDVIDSVTTMGTVKRKFTSRNFRGGHVTTIMGYTTIDLTAADISGTVRLEVTQTMGGTNIIVPPDWEVRSDVSAVLAGFEDKRGKPAVTNPEKVLIINGTCVLGGIEVRTMA